MPQPDAESINVLYKAISQRDELRQQYAETTDKLIEAHRKLETINRQIIAQQAAIIKQLQDKLNALPS